MVYESMGPVLTLIGFSILSRFNTLPCKYHCQHRLWIAVQVTGLGRRISIVFVRIFGNSLIGMGYALCFAGEFYLWQCFNITCEALSTTNTWPALLQHIQK